MDTVKSYCSPLNDDIWDLTEALAGAFAEGIDLGPRGAQIRDLGQALETAIDALRSKLVELSEQMQIDSELSSLSQLTHMARLARAYGID